MRRVEHGYDNHTATWYTPLRKAAPNAIVTYEQRLGRRKREKQSRRALHINYGRILLRKARVMKMGVGDG